jgi:microcystin-dependent protein
MLLPQAPEPRDSWRWGTVTAQAPLRVLLDGDAVSLSSTPDCLVPAYIGDRVWCQLVGRRVVVHGSPRAGRVPGVIEMYGGGTVQPGKVFCDGAAYSRTIYAALFAAIGTTYGVGDGLTTFNVPQASGRALVGKGAQTEFNALGKSGGEISHLLTTAESPAHMHNVGHNVKDVASAVIDGAIYGTGPGAGTFGFNPDTVGSGTFYPFTTSASGGGAAHNNMPPYIVVNFTINT